MGRNKKSKNEDDDYLAEMAAAAGELEQPEEVQGAANSDIHNKPPPSNVVEDQEEVAATATTTKTTTTTGKQSQQKQKPKSKKSKKNDGGDDDYLAEMAAAAGELEQTPDEQPQQQPQEDSSQNHDDDEQVSPAAAKSKKKQQQQQQKQQKQQKQAVATEPSSSSAEDGGITTTAAAAKSNKKNKKNKNEDNDYLAELAAAADEVETTPTTAAEPEPEPVSNSSSKKQKDKKQKKDITHATATTTATDGDQVDEGDDSTTTTTTTTTAPAAATTAAGKPKKKENASGGGGGGGKKKEPPKKSAALEAAIKQRQKLQAEMERQRREEEERRKEEERKRREEEERLKREEEERERARLERKKQKAELVAKGLWLSKKEKEKKQFEEQRAALLLQTLAEQGLIVPALSSSGAPGEKHPPRSAKPDKKHKQQQQQQHSSKNKKPEKADADAAEIEESVVDANVGTTDEQSSPSTSDQQQPESSSTGDLSAEHGGTESKSKTTTAAAQQPSGKKQKAVAKAKPAPVDTQPKVPAGVPLSWMDLLKEEEPLPPSESATSQPSPPSTESPSQPSQAPPKEKAVKSTVSTTNQAESTSDDSGDDSEEDTDERRKEAARKRREDRITKAKSERSQDNLRSPILCVLGHVDTGKTKLLDKMRSTNVQEGEAGGITQQIGATYFPLDSLMALTSALNDKLQLQFKIPGLLVIDTPGHESFTNLRSRGSSLCDIAVLVVDIMHGLEPQTIESLNLLRKRKTPFVVALNKIDRMFGWNPHPNEPFISTFKKQPSNAQQEFERRANETMVAFQEQGLNAKLYHQNKDFRKVVSLVPTSAITGEGIPDLLGLMVKLTQQLMTERLMYMSELQSTILEVKVIEGIGTTIDVVLVNGEIHEGDTIVVCTLNGPVVTTIRALLTPRPLREIRVKTDYVHHKSIRAAQGVKIAAQNLEGAVAGSQLYVLGPDDDVEELKDAAMEDLHNMLAKVDRSGRGVCVQASTLGSLEALLDFLKSDAVRIPVSGINIGPVHLKDVKRASVMLDRAPEFAVILAFDVNVAKEARELADELGVKIFTAEIIYHLFDQFKLYMEKVKEEKRKNATMEAVFPCVIQIIPQYVFNKKDPIIVGVDVKEGVLKIGTPLIVPGKEMLEIGRVVSIEKEHKEVSIANRGDSVAIKIAAPPHVLYGRHFDNTDTIISKLSRRSIDSLKENFKDDLSKDDWKLVIKLKGILNIV